MSLLIRTGAAVAVGLLASCGDDDGGGGGSGLTVTKSAGDAQTGAPGTVLPTPLEVVVELDDVPDESRDVTWATPDGGTLNPTTSATDINGVATSVWTLGTGSGPQTATATVAGAVVPTVTFTANGVAATVQVSNNTFSPAVVNLPVGGGTVSWVWQGGAVGHNVKPASTNIEQRPNSGGQQNDLHSAPFEFSATFTASGEYKYFCIAHGSESPAGTVNGMSGTVVVAP